MPPERRGALRASRYLEVRLDGLQLHRDARHLLHDLHWRVMPGQRWVVLGANGAGKTQLLKVLAGAVWPDPAPHPVRRYRWRGAWQSTPYGVLEEIAYVGPERQDRYERYGWNFTALQVVGTGLTRSDIPQGPLSAAQQRRALAVLERLDLRRLARRRLLSLSFGERRLILLARALASAPRLLLLDELFAGLDAAYRDRVLRWLEGSARAALPWVLTSHRLEEVPASATHLLRLDAGRIVASGPIGTPTPHRGARASPARRRPRVVARSVGAPPSVPSDALVRLQAASVYLDYRPVLRRVTLAVRPGDCWVVHGANGSGKSTLLRTIYGDHPVALGGRIERLGIDPGVPLSEFRRRCAIVAPHLHADYPRDSRLLDVVVSGLHSSIGLDAPPNTLELSAARRALRAFGLASKSGRSLGVLSYGQARRVMFARATVCAPSLLLLDEPFAGVDLATRRALRRGIETLVSAGTAVVMASHHPDEWSENASHELELDAGRVRYGGPVRGRASR